ncbi:hypothetical protein H1C71_013913 [Ictidomys tridecemlineatus]|nr:hypothetical protein H1C71_013913 [Ictidomys tridecemlineatus]KAG3292579.1 hypothetical protein H1C71_013913 [Ictidomys tridecemlineatus]KAG3292580.1 hypothetical protein H1C71_013913 [Ictidomys tridecemlineatus]KAG3292581.1 hypothetical protein H1C71_013913 [Ictidomys tridecemlineatus]KAG3292582.1 hypothetical protein H1C71_013913 [Ictidomys tridecemlineatus]
MGVNGEPDQEWGQKDSKRNHGLGFIIPLLPELLGACPLLRQAQNKRDQGRGCDLIPQSSPFPPMLSFVQDQSVTMAAHSSCPLPQMFTLLSLQPGLINIFINFYHQTCLRDKQEMLT